MPATFAVVRSSKYRHETAAMPIGGASSLGAPDNRRVMSANVAAALVASTGATRENITSFWRYLVRRVTRLAQSRHG